MNFLKLLGDSVREYKYQILTMHTLQLGIFQPFTGPGVYIVILNYEVSPLTSLHRTLHCFIWSRVLQKSS